MEGALDLSFDRLLMMMMMCVCVCVCSNIYGFEVLKFFKATYGGDFENDAKHCNAVCQKVQVIAGGVHRNQRLKRVAAAQQCPRVSGGAG